MRRLALLAALSVAVSACLPSRDNSADPSNAPSSGLRVIDRGDDTGTCPAALVATSADIEVFSASRGRCLSLDASATKDPQGSTALHFAYHLVDSAGNDLEAIGGDAPIVPLDSTFRHGHPPGEVLRFRVRASDDSGAYSFSSATVVLTNARPTAVTPPPRTLPRGGFAWNLGAPFLLRFDPSASTDPDHDPTLVYCWDFAPALTTSIDCPAQESHVCSSDPADPLFTRCVGSALANSLRATATLRVMDSATPAFALSSLAATTTVTIGVENAWVGSGVDIGDFQRLDGLRTTYDFGALSGESFGLYLPSSPRRVVIAAKTAAPGYSLQLANWPSGTVTSSTQITGSSSSGIEMTPLPDGTGLWIGLPGPGGTTNVRRWDLNGSSLVGGTTTNVAVLPGITGYHTPPFVSDTAGNLWISNLTETSISTVDRDGTPGVSVPGEPGRIVVSLSARPQSSEIWSVQTQDWVNGGPAASTLLVRHASRAAAPVAYDVGAPLLVDLAWVDHDAAWILSIEEGLVLLDVSALEAGASFEDAVLARVPDSFNASSLRVDPATGTLWASDVITRVVYRASRSGDLAIYPTVTDQVPEAQFIDDDGALWFYDRETSTIKRGLSASREAIVQEVALLGGFNASVDFTTGGLWAPTFFPTSILHLAEDGQVMASYTTLIYESNGAPSQASSFPGLVLFRLDPGGSTAWGAPFDLFTNTPLGLYRIDLAVNPPYARKVLDGGTVNQLAANGGDVVLEPFAPAAGAAKLTWTATKGPGSPGTGVPARILVMDTAGQMSSLFSIPAIEVDASSSPRLDLHAARSLKTNKLCVATLEANSAGTIRTVHVRRIAPSGFVETLGTFAVAPNGRLGGVAASSDASRDVCWIEVDDQTDPSNPTTTFQGWSSTNVIWRTFVQPGLPSGQHNFYSPSPTQIFAAMELQPGYVSHRVLIESLNGITTRTELMDGERATFLSPDSH